MLYGVVRGSTTGGPACRTYESVTMNKVVTGVFQSLLSAGLAFTALGVRRLLKSENVYLSCLLLVAAGGIGQVLLCKDVIRLDEFLATTSCPRSCLTHGVVRHTIGKIQKNLE